MLLTGCSDAANGEACDRIFTFGSFRIQDSAGVCRRFALCYTANRKGNLTEYNFKFEPFPSYFMAQNHFFSDFSKARAREIVKKNYRSLKYLLMTCI